MRASCPFRLRRGHQRDGRQVRRECRPGSIIDFRYVSAEVHADLALLRDIKAKHALTDAEDFELSKALDTGRPEILDEKLRAAYDEYDAFRKPLSKELRDAGLIPEEIIQSGNRVGDAQGNLILRTPQARLAIPAAEVFF